MGHCEIVHKITGKGRPRFGRGRTYTPKTTTDYEKLVKGSYDGVLHDGPVRIFIFAYYSIPKSYTKKRRKEILEHHELPQKKPDIDNIAKIILDGLNGVAYHDDVQVTDIVVSKSYHEEENDKVIVEVTEV